MQPGAPKEEDDEVEIVSNNNEASDDVQMIEEVPENRRDNIDDECSQIEDENSMVSQEDDDTDLKKERQLEKKLHAELNLRMGQIGFGQVLDDEESSEMIKHGSKKKVPQAKKKHHHPHDSKLKQTRLIFTPKEDSSANIAGQKRAYPESPNQFNQDDEEE